MNKRNERLITWLEEQMRCHDTGLRGIGRKAGIGNSTISRWMSGQGDPSDDNVRRLAEAFDVEAKFLYELLGRVEPTQIVELDEEERQIIETYRALPTIGERKRFIRLAEAFGAYEPDNHRQQTDPQPAES